MYINEEDNEIENNLPNWCFDYEKSFGKLINNEANDKSRKAFLENRNKSSHNNTNHNCNITNNNIASLKKDYGTLNQISNASNNDSSQIIGDNSNNLITSNSKNKKEKGVSTKQQIDNQIRTDLSLANKLAESDNKPSRNTRYSNRVNNYESNNLNNLNNISNINTTTSTKKLGSNLLGEKRANSSLGQSNSANSDYSEEKSDVRLKENKKANVLKEKTDNVKNNDIQAKTETLKLVLINTSPESTTSVFSSSIVNLYFIL